MTAGSGESIEPYVRAALALQGYRFDEQQIAEIVAQFARIEAMALAVYECPLPIASEPAPVFRP